jgi:hypothetical protein
LCAGLAAAARIDQGEKHRSFWAFSATALVVLPLILLVRWKRQRLGAK